MRQPEPASERRRAEGSGYLQIDAPMISVKHGFARRMSDTAFTDMSPRIRWQDWTNVALGAWLVVSPYLLEYSLDGPATSNAMGVGAMLLIFNIISACRLVDRGEEIFNIVIGAWLLLSPFALAVEATSPAGLNAMAAGGCVVILALSQMYGAARRKTPG